MSIKNRFSVKMLLIALATILSFGLAIAFSSTQAMAEGNSNVAIQSWDVSDNNATLTATLFVNPNFQGKYDLVIEGSGRMKNYNQTDEKAPWKENDYSSNIVSISLPEGLTTIGSNAFHGCVSLKSIDIPETVTDIYSCAFEGCTSLQNITGGEGIVGIRMRAFYGVAITSFPFDSSLKLKDLESQTFAHTNIVDVTLPASLKTVGPKVFAESPSLVRVNVKGLETTIANINVFENCSDNLVVKAHNSTNIDELLPAKNFQSSCEYDDCNDKECNVCLTVGKGGKHVGSWTEITKPSKTGEGVIQIRCEFDHTHVEEIILPTLNKEDYQYSVVKESTVNETGLATYTIVVDDQAFIYSEIIPIVREGLLDEATFKDATFGIVLGAIALVAVLSFGIFWFNLKRKR